MIQIRVVAYCHDNKNSKIDENADIRVWPVIHDELLLHSQVITHPGKVWEQAYDLLLGGQWWGQELS